MASMPLLFSCAFHQGTGSSVSNAPSKDSSLQTASSDGDCLSSQEESSFPKGEDGFKQFDLSYFENHNDPNDDKKRSKVRFGEAVEGIPLYPTLRLFAAGDQVPVYAVKTNPNRIWDGEASNRQDDAVASLSLEGKVTLKLQCAFNPAKNVTIRPLGRGVPYTVDQARWVISFTISSPGQYVVETRQRTLHLFVNPLTEAPAGATVFKAGLHTKENDSRINSNDEIILRNGNRIYFEEGAIVRAKLRASDAYNVSVTGPGFLDGSTFDRSVKRGTTAVPVDFSFCRNVTLSDFACLDPAGWAFNMFFDEGVAMKNLKVISSRSNGDGISLQSCKSVEVDDCFLRTWDDSLVVKNYVNWRNGAEGETSSIRFSDCLIITDLAQSMEIGYETIGEKMEDISFLDITVLHAYHKPVFSIHDGNNAKIRNVTYQNITVEDASIGKGDGTDNLFDFDVSYSPTWSDNHKKTALGDVSGVHCSNIKVLKGRKDPKVKITGSVETRSGYPNVEHRVEGVSFEDVEIYGEILDENYPHLRLEHADAPSFSATGKAVTGASYPSLDLSSYGNNIEKI